MGYRKVDQNQEEIVAAIRKCGCGVIDLHKLGKGVPDILVSRLDGEIELIEIKNPKAKGRLNPLQKQWHAEWRGRPVQVVRTVDEALKVIGVIP